LADELVCEEHGAVEGRIVCRHLEPATSGLGFYDVEGNPTPGAMCENCLMRWREDGGWTVENEAEMGFRLICLTCFESARATNESANTLRIVDG
jgi:hypothetical protein